MMNAIITLDLEILVFSNTARLRTFNDLKDNCIKQNPRLGDQIWQQRL